MPDGPSPPVQQRVGLRVAVVAAHYSEHRFNERTTIVDAVVHAVAADLLVSVTNHVHVRPEWLQRPDGCGGESIVIQHDNSGLEFGAYQVGLDAVMDRGGSDWVLFVNDTISIHRAFPNAHLRRLAVEIARDADPEPVCVGEIESLPRSYELLGARSHRWVSTHVFALNRAALRCLDDKVRFSEIDSLITSSDSPDEFFAAGLDPVLRQHFAAWLFGQHEGLSWYRSAPLTSANVELMAPKARSLLQEKYLSAALESVSTRFVDIKALTSRRERVVRFLQTSWFNSQQG